MNSGGMDVSEDHVLFMDVSNTAAHLPEDRQNLSQAEWSFAKGFPGGDVIWRLAGELQKATRHLIVKILQGSGYVQEVGVVELAELLGDLPCQLLLLLPQSGEINKGNQLYLGYALPKENIRMTAWICVVVAPERDHSIFWFSIEIVKVLRVHIKIVVDTPEFTLILPLILHIAALISSRIIV